MTTLEFRGKVPAMKLCQRVLLVLTTVLAVAGASAQTPTGNLHGQITDPSAAVIANATIAAKGPQGRKIEVKTDRAGNYTFKGLPPGRYSLIVSSKGFEDIASDVTIVSGKDERLDLSLPIAVQHREITVESSDQGPDANDPSSNASALVLKGKELDALSDDPDQLEAELQSLAGGSAGPNGGQIYIDGFTGSKLPPKTAIREIRINQNPFSAEFDRLGYGRIDILTKPGGNKVHGRVLVEGNHSSFNARNPFVSQKPEYHTVLAGGMIEGPLGKNGSFSFSGEHRNINNSNVVNAVILDSGLNPVPFNQAIPDPRTLTLINPRVDFQLSPNNTFFGRYQWYNSGEQGAGVGQFGLGSQALSLQKTEHDLQLSDSQILGSTMVNNLRFEYRYDTTGQTPLNLSPQISVLGAFTGGGSSLGNVITRQNHFELHEIFSKISGPHALRFGVRTRATGEADRSTQNFNGTFTFSSLTAFQITQNGLQQGLTPSQIRAAGGGASLFSVVSGQPAVSDLSFDVGVFAQDDWRLRPNMTLSYGLRFETQNDIHARPNLVPRVGFAWGLGSSKKGTAPKTVLRAGYGLFYDRFPQNLVLNSRHLDGIHTQQFIVQSPDFFPSAPTAATLAGSQVPPTVYQVDPKLTAPYIMQTAVTLERKLARNSTISVTYLNSRGENQLISRNINAPLPGTFDPNNPSSGIRPLGNIGNIYQYQSEGIFRQNQVTTNFALRPKWVTLTGYYVFSYASSDTAGAGSFPSNQFDIAADYGRAAYDVRHKLAMFSSFDLPRGFILIPFVLASSGRPYDITVGRDLNGDSIFNDRPAFATDLSRPSVVFTRLGAFDTAPLPGQKIIPPNFGDGPGVFNVNLRLTKAFAFGERDDLASSSTGPQKAGNSTNPFGGTWKPQFTLRFDVVVSNLLNHVNAGAPIGNLSSPLFGMSNSLAPLLGTLSNSNRRINLQMQFLF